MAGEGTKRIIDLTEAAETQSGDYIAIDSTGRGTRKLPAGSIRRDISIVINNLESALNG